MIDVMICAKIVNEEHEYNAMYIVSPTSNRDLSVALSVIPAHIVPASLLIYFDTVLDPREDLDLTGSRRKQRCLHLASPWLSVQR